MGWSSLHKAKELTGFEARRGLRALRSSWDWDVDFGLFGSPDPVRCPGANGQRIFARDIGWRVEDRNGRGLTVQRSCRWRG